MWAENLVFRQYNLLLVLELLFFLFAQDMDWKNHFKIMG